MTNLRRLTTASILVCSSLLFDSRALGDEEDERPAKYEVQRFELGMVKGTKLTAEVRYPVTKFGGVTVEIRADEPDGSVKNYLDSFRIVFANTVTVRVGDFAGLGRKQIFVTGTHRATDAYIYDCDGNSMRKIYECTLLGSVRPIWRGKRWLIQEDCARSQWEDTMGVGYEQPENLIRRTMRWDGFKFVPEKPRPNTIIRR